MGLEMTWPWLVLLALGAVHGVNPGMGWLFAVALGLQERDGRAVWRALLPLAAGHFLAIAAVVAIGLAVGRAVSLDHLKWAVAAILLGFGIAKLLRNRHPRFGGMRVGFRDLTVWSFLMASAHGAGLMVLPVVLGGLRSTAAATPAQASGAAVAGAHGAHAMTPEAGHGVHAAAMMADPSAQELWAAAATILHTGGYLLVTALLAAVVYRWLGLGLLRRSWVNLDLVWAGALILTAVLTPLI